MKKTNAYSNKLAIVATSIVMAYFASGISSIAQATELLKAEPVKQASLISQAQANLALSFATITIATNSTQDSAKDMVAQKEVSATQHTATSLNKTTLVSE